MKVELDFFRFQVYLFGSITEMHDFAFSDKSVHRSNGEKACAILGIQYNQKLNGQTLYWLQASLLGIGQLLWSHKRIQNLLAFIPTSKLWKALHILWMRGSYFWICTTLEDLNWQGLEQIFVTLLWKCSHCVIYCIQIFL